LSREPPCAGAQGPEPPKDQPEKKLSFKEKLLKYGVVGLVYWNVLWLGTGIALYVVSTGAWRKRLREFDVQTFPSLQTIEYKLLGDVDVIGLARMAQLDRFIDLGRRPHLVCQGLHVLTAWFIDTLRRSDQPNGGESGGRAVAERGARGCTAAIHALDRAGRGSALGSDEDQRPGEEIG
jgi:hypothetical protein